MTTNISILFSITLLFVVILCCRNSAASTIDLYQIIKCENPQFDPKIIGWFYGCYCGAGGAGTPVDKVDKCCQQHDRCYQQFQASPGCAVFWPLLSTFDYSCQNQKATCHDNNPCKQAHCNCDIQFAHCLHGLATPSKKPQCKDYFRSQKTGFINWFTH